ncbi:MAG TPA: hypothetical protein VIY86_07240, partial [Pirellulaceae bacterium]
ESKIDLQIASGSVFVETFTTMAAGATLATVLVLTVLNSDTRLRLVAFGLVAVCMLLSQPSLIRACGRGLGVDRWSPPLAAALKHLDASLILSGWGWALLSWSGMGLSLWCVIKSLPLDTGRLGEIEAFPLCVATVGLSVTAGFVSLLPGGVLAREWVMMQLLAPSYGSYLALLIPVAIRINWLLTELVGSGILFFVKGHSRTRHAAVNCDPGVQ